MKTKQEVIDRLILERDISINQDTKEALNFAIRQVNQIFIVNQPENQKEPFEEYRENNPLPSKMKIGEKYIQLDLEESTGQKIVPDDYLKYLRTIDDRTYKMNLRLDKFEKSLGMLYGINRKIKEVM